MSARGGPSTPREPKKLNAEAMEKLVAHLYAESIQHRDVELKKAEKKYNPTAPPLRKPQADIDASCERQSQKEVEMRRQRAEQAAAKQAKEQALAASGGKAADSPRKLSPEELEESVRKQYYDAVRIRGENRKRLEKKFTFENAAVVRGREKKINQEELKAAADRLSVPKKTTFNADEINKLWLRVETHYCDGTKKAQEDDDEGDG